MNSNTWKQRLFRVRTKNLMLGLIFPLLLITAPTVNGQDGWVASKIASGEDLNTVYFLDNKHGWVGGDGGFLSRTDDGGQSWVRQLIPTKAAINDIYFRDKDAGFLVAGSTIFVTRDNGARWNGVRAFDPNEFEGADVELYSIRFSSKKKGWVVGSVSKRDRVVDSVLVYTNDGGETWQRQRAPSRLELIHIEFVNDKRGWIVGDGGTILATTNGGESWSPQQSGTNATLYHVDFRSEKKGVAVGERGTILRTLDGGNTWTPIAVQSHATLLSVQFINDDNCWIIGRGGTILRTDDGGLTWISQESGTKNNLYSLYLVKKTGWAVGGGGLLLRYEL